LNSTSSGIGRQYSGRWHDNVSVVLLFVSEQFNYVISGNDSDESIIITDWGRRILWLAIRAVAS
jgi:hypothetical protein